VGNDQDRCPDHHILVKQDVNVNRSRAFVYSRAPPKSPLYGFDGFEKLHRHELRRGFYGAIQEPRLGPKIDGFSFVI
jgi:hypothetical protein